mgnify:CR=1 FL=1|jgi:hypothetical protein
MTQHTEQNKTFRKKRQQAESALSDELVKLHGRFTDAVQLAFHMQLVGLEPPASMLTALEEYKEMLITYAALHEAASHARVDEINAEQAAAEGNV